MPEVKVVREKTTRPSGEPASSGEAMALLASVVGHAQRHDQESRRDREIGEHEAQAIGHLTKLVEALRFQEASSEQHAAALERQETPRPSPQGHGGYN